MSATEPKTEPFEIEIPDAVLDDVRTRLQMMRWVDEPDNEDWKYGTSETYLKELVDYWLNDYDWRKVEAELNSFDNFKTVIDGEPIHYILEQGKGPNPRPLICSHGWPWTYWDLHKTIRPLADPGAHGGDPEDAFAKHHPWTPENDSKPVVPVPSCVAMWPQELMLMPTPLMEDTFNLQRVTEDLPGGGHYAPMEQPDELIEDVRSFFREYR